MTYNDVKAFYFINENHTYNFNQTNSVREEYQYTRLTEENRN